jgi:hypothetical protein
MHVNDSREFLNSLSPMGMVSDIKDIVDAILYLTEAGQVTGEVLTCGRWCAQRQVVIRTEKRLAAVEFRTF